MSVMNREAGYRGVAVLLTLGTFGFVWLYPNPLACDMPMHIAAAKALSVLIDGPPPADYPYVLNLRIAPYALAEVLLVAPIGLFGVVTGTKLALSIYALVFPLSLGFLVAQVNPQSRWTRLIGFPLTLNYFFHYGFWPFIVGLCGAVLAIGLSIKWASHRHAAVGNALARLVTFALHPVAAVPLAIYDFSVVMLPRGKPGAWYAPGTWDWGAVLKLWSLVFAFVVLVLVTNQGGYGGAMQWVDPWHQLTQILRPLFITKHAAELAIPVVLGLWIFYRGRAEIVRSEHRPLLRAGLLMIGIGTLFPRLQFLGSWEQGVRVVFVGWIVLLSLWSFLEPAMKKQVVAWILLVFISNLGVSHALWMRHSPSFESALDVLQHEIPGARISLQEERFTPSSPSIPIGAHVDLWAWALGSAADAYNSAAAWNFGPVKYVGLSTPGPIEAIVIYHPYELWPTIAEPFQQRFMADDEIYSIYRM